MELDAAVVGEHGHPLAVRNSNASSVSSAPRGGKGNARRVCAAAPRVKRKKCTYYERKDEIAALEAEVKRLKSVLCHPDSERCLEREQLKRDKVTNTVLRDDILRLQLSAMGAQSLIAHHISTWRQSPIESCIKLPSDLMGRHRTLLSLRDEKLRLGTTFLRERTRFSDLRQRCSHVDESEASNGDYVVTRFDVTPMPGQVDVQRVYDEVLRFNANQDFVVAENTGIVTVRDTDQGDDALVSQCRFLSAITEGLDVEANTARFNRFTDCSNELCVPHGLTVVDFVDEDELYPYHPEIRVREDVSQALLVVAIPPGSEFGLPGATHTSSSTASTHAGDDEPGQSSVVSIVRWLSMRFRRPRCSTTRDKELLMYETMMRWGEVLPKAVRERMAERGAEQQS